MVIKFYKTTSEKNDLNKMLENENIITGTLKDNCDILNPTITFKYDNNLLLYNYAYIEAFNRYYFIDSFNIIGKTVEITFHVDVLYTYKNDIKNSYATITRSNRGNKYIPDNRIVKSSNVIQTFRKLGGGVIPYNSYILVVAGDVLTFDSTNRSTHGEGEE